MNRIFGYKRVKILNMKYFLHDSNSFNDEKITRLFMEYGYEGLGLFYTLLEKLAQQEKPINSDVLKHQLKVGKRLEKCWCFMEEIGIISSNNGETFNEQLLNFSNKYKIKKEKNAKRISEWRENQAIENNVTCYKSVRNTTKVNRSKVNINKGIEINKEEISIDSILSFDDFWILYDKKVGDKNKLSKKYDLISESDRKLILEHIPKYKLSQPDKKFRKDPQTYLNNKSWNDEIVGYIDSNTTNPNIKIPTTKKEFTVKWMYNGGLTRTYLCDSFEDAQKMYSNNFGVPPHEVIPGIK